MVVAEYGPQKLLERLADPRWFQAFGCVLGFDWHSSGVTTTTCGALKEGIRGKEQALGFYAAGGKGAVSRKTPDHITQLADSCHLSVDVPGLIHASKMSAKVDNTAVQDGYQLYHHAFFFTSSGAWGVVQQGMNGDTKYARRYHWFSPNVETFVNEPHSGIASEARGQQVLNMVAGESEDSRSAVTSLILEGPAAVEKEISAVSRLELPGRHWIAPEDLRPRGMQKVLVDAYEAAPASFESVLGTKGMGPKTLRALVMVAELAYGAAPSWRDPAVYSFAHGGKDGIPYPVDRPLYDETVLILKRAIERSKLGSSDKLSAIRRLAAFWPEGL